MNKESKELTIEEYLEILKELSEQIRNPKIREEVNNKHDKTFKIILENKEEAAYFINKVIDFKEKIKPEELEKYNKSFITKNLKIQEADIVYKLKNKKVFILIEHQTKVDYSMAYRILNYQIEIMRSYTEEKQVKNKSYEHALVIAIVLYTGARKWTAKRKIQEIQAKVELHTIMPMLENYYYIVDNNNYSKKELLEDKSFLSKIMLLEKSNSREELLKNLYEIIPKATKENKEKLTRIINYAYKDYFNEETINGIINKIEMKGEDSMLASVQMLEREKRKEERKIKLVEARSIKLGETQSTMKIAKKMLKENFSIELIEKITGLKREKFM